MKRILLILVLFITTIAQSQEKTFEKEVSKIAQRIENITTQQKDSLKVKVIAIDRRLETGEITITTSETLKKELAAYHARRIEKLVGEQERLLQLLVQDKTNGKIASSNEVSFDDDDINTFTVGRNTFRFSINNDDDDDDDDDFDTEKKKDDRKKDRGLGNRTTSQFVFALGVNNILENNDLSSLNNSTYQFWRSRFYEVGFTWKTRINKRPSQLYFKYGVSFLWNNLRPENNQFHIKNDEVTELQDFPENLSESRLRHVQMNFPMHLEWDLSKNRVFKDGGISDRTHRSVRIGVGGFVGFKLGTRQYLEYSDVNNIDVEEVQYDNFNMNTVNYGLSTYLGYKSTSFYVKYDLNPLFKDTETRNISMGIRFDFN
jgi:hypothetical protein